MHFAEMLYRNVSHSLFEDDKLPFAVLMLARFMVATGLATREEANLLLYGRATEGKSALALITDSNAASSGRRTSSAAGASFYGSPSMNSPSKTSVGTSRFASKTPSAPFNIQPRSSEGEPPASESSAPIIQGIESNRIKADGADEDQEEANEQETGARGVIKRVVKEVAAQEDEYDGDRAAGEEADLLRALLDANESENGDRRMDGGRESLVSNSRPSVSPLRSDIILFILKTAHCSDPFLECSVRVRTLVMSSREPLLQQPPQGASFLVTPSSPQRDQRSGLHSPSSTAPLQSTHQRSNCSKEDFPSLGVVNLADQ